MEDFICYGQNINIYLYWTPPINIVYDKSNYKYFEIPTAAAAKLFNLFTYR